jgi:hypothetical protein
MKWCPDFCFCGVYLCFHTVLTTEGVIIRFDPHWAVMVKIISSCLCSPVVVQSAMRQVVSHFISCYDWQGVNSLSAMDSCDRPLLNKLRSTVVSCQIFIRSQSLIARWTRNYFNLPAVARNFNEVCCIDDVSRGSKSYLFCANIYLPICALCR